MANPVATLGGIPFRTGPDEIRWQFDMKVQTKKTLGGKVIQILGTTLGDMTVSGIFGVASDGTGENYSDQLAFRQQIIDWSRAAEGQINPNPIRFTYAPRAWDFQVFVKTISGFKFAVDAIAPRWTLTLHLLDPGARTLVKDISDAYIKRLMEGVGWTQTDYNGPTADQLAAKLSGQTMGEYLAGLAQDAFEAGLPGGQQKSTVP